MEPNTVAPAKPASLTPTSLPARRPTRSSSGPRSRSRSHPGRAGEGLLVLDAGRQALSGLQQSADVREHRPRRRARHQSHPGAGGHCLPTPTRSWRPSRARGWARSSPTIAPGDIDVFFFTNGGAEANENAIKIARLYTGRHKILARYRSYHGGTAGAITLTGDPRRWASEPGIPGVIHVLDPYHGIQRGWDHVGHALADLEEVIQLEGPQTIAAFFLEPVTGTNGVLIPPDGYLAGRPRALRRSTES